MNNEIIARYYAAHVDELRAFFLARTANRELSEDMAQDVFVRLLGYEMITELTLPCLTYTVARRMLTDYFRHCEAIRKCSQTETANSFDTNDPYTTCLANELAGILERGIKALPEQCQQVYRMHIYGGMKVSRIAEVTNIKYKVVERRLGIARSEVRAFVRSAVG